MRELTEKRFERFTLPAFRPILFTLALSLVASCSDQSLSSGTYRLSQVNFSRDECNISDKIPEGHEIDVRVVDSKIMIYMLKDLTPPAGTMIGGTFTAFSTREADIIPKTDCRDMWIKKVTGKVVQKNVLAGTYEFIDKPLSGNDCADEEKIGFHGPICTSSVTFRATKR